MKAKKAVFPVAGLGTRFLPMTKAIPKEMLPVLDKPLIQYVVEEAREAGIKEFIMVIAKGKEALAHHFDRSPELESQLAASQKTELLEALQNVRPRADESFIFVRQYEALGLGHAVLCAAPCVGHEPFAVLLPDDFIDAAPGVLSQMVAQQGADGKNCVAVMEVSSDEVRRYGILDIPQFTHTIPAMIPARNIVEKPLPAEAPSRMAAIGRYILQPEIFSVLARQSTGHGKEIQLTDALANMIPTHGLMGMPFKGNRYDCGSLEGWLSAQMAMARKIPELRAVVERYARHEA